MTQGATTIGTGTTDASGDACVDVPSTGTYNVAASKSGQNGSNKNVDVTCPGTTYVTLRTDGTAGVRFHVSGCLTDLSGAVVTVDDGEYTTDSGGHTPYLVLATGSYGYSVSHDRYDTNTATAVISTCASTSTIGVTLTAATGYVCPPVTACELPWATTLYCTTPVGTITLNWYSVSSRFIGVATFNPSGTSCKNCFSAAYGGCSTGIAIILNTSATAMGLYVTADSFSGSFYDDGGYFTVASGALVANGPHCPTTSNLSLGSFSYSCGPLSVSATVSGLTGNFAQLNGTYTFTE